MTETGFPSFDDDDDEDLDAQQATKSKPFVELRKHTRALEKQLKEVAPELEALRAYKQERDEQERVSSLKGVFAAVGLKESQISLYPTDSEPSEEQIRAWATKHDLVAAESGEPQETTSTGFKPVTTDGPAAGASGKISRAEWTKLQREGPDGFEKAQRLFKEGRVDLSDLGGKYGSSQA